MDPGKMSLQTLISAFIYPCSLFLLLQNCWIACCEHSSPDQCWLSSPYPDLTGRYGRSYGPNTAELFWMIPNLPKSVNVYFSFPVALLAKYKWVGTMKAIHDPALEGSRQCQLHDHYWPSVTPSNIIEKGRLWSQSTIALQPSVTFLPRARSVHN